MIYDTLVHLYQRCSPRDHGLGSATARDQDLRSLVLVVELVVLVLVGCVAQW